MFADNKSPFLDEANQDQNSNFLPDGEDNFGQLSNNRHRYRHHLRKLNRVWGLIWITIYLAMLVLLVLLVVLFSRIIFWFVYLFIIASLVGPGWCLAQGTYIEKIL